MPTVKTAISLDQKLFKQADRAAKKQRISRSQFFARAVEEYLNRRRGEEITRKLNEVYADNPETEEDRKFRELMNQNFAKLADPW